MDIPPSSGDPAQRSFDNSQDSAVEARLPRSIPYATYAIIGVTVAFYILQILSVVTFGYPTAFTNMDWLELFGARINELIQAGQIWRLLTPALLHGSFPHIFFNMYALFSLGSNLESFFGRGRFLSLYILGAFTGNVTSFLFADGSYSVGASTAIFGLIGAEGVFLVQNRKLFAGQFDHAIRNVVFIVCVNLFVLGSLPNIDNAGHIGGLLGGLMFTSLAGPIWQVEKNEFGFSLTDKRPTRDIISGTAAVLFIFGALTLWGLLR